MKKLIFLSTILFCITPIFATTSTEEETTGVERYAIYIGSNKGGKNREQLLYAGSDAMNFQKTMSEIGGVSEGNSFILIDPNKEKIDETLSQISKKINSGESHAKRSEFIFYYSGHSDENALLLGDIPYDYSSLKTAITEVPSDIHVVILDSCYSGNFIRTKGGQKRKPFLMDDSSVVTGHAYLSSSSTNEYSQESDEIEASYFTNAMITGLRGAADTSGDNKVTLNELYSYAFNDTLSRTESSKAGPQHPNYNITLVGSGDLVLSDISTAEAMLSLSKEAKGKFIIRNEEGKLISEINKSAGQPIFMALPAGQYSAVIIDEYSTKQGYFNLSKEQIYVLDQNSLSSIKRKNNRVRGGSSDDDDEFLSLDGLEETRDENAEPRRGSRRRYIQEDDSEEISASNFVVEVTKESEEDDEDKDETPTIDFDEMDSFHLALVPGFTFLKIDGSHNTVFSAVGLFGSSEKNIFGFQISNFMNVASGSVYGAQFSGFMNISSKEVKGIQATGFMNIGKNIQGAQASGFMNVATDVDGVQATGFLNVAKKVNGVQAGIINIADENNGLALGLINIIKNGVHDLSVTWNSNDMVDCSFKSGTNLLYFTIGAEAPRHTVFDRENATLLEKETGLFYGGLGSRIIVPVCSFDFDFLWKVLFNSTNYTRTERIARDSIIVEQIPSFGFTLTLFPESHINLIGGVNFDININGFNDRAFNILNTKLNWNLNNDVSLKPAFFFGMKIR